MRPEPPSTVALGPRANWRQFWLLVVVNAFVGAMVGLERTVLPLLAQAEFGLASKTAALSFIATFGIVKALTNYFAGRMSDRYGRKPVLLGSRPRQPAALPALQGGVWRAGAFRAWRWKGWTEPRSHARLKPVYDSLRAVWTPAGAPARRAQRAP